jgi:Zn-finger nucleic acid-binding protein
MYVKCPVCAKMMNRINFGARSGVVIDRCREHGVWLEAGELRQLSEWMKAGGRLLDNEREEERKKEALREEQKRQKLSQGGMNPADEEQDLFAIQMRSEMDLLTIVSKAVRFLTKL